MILRISLLLIFFTQTWAQFFGPPQFDCLRIHPSYCCSSRVRFSCPQLCNQRPCQRTPTFIQPMSPHIPPVLPFKGLTPQQPQQPQKPQQSRLPDLIDPTSITHTSAQFSQKPAPRLPEPPPGIVLPPEGTPLASGTPFPPSNPSPRTITDNEFGSVNSALRPVDGFAPARGGGNQTLSTFTATSVGAGGSFAPSPNVNTFVGIAPNNGPQPNPNTNQFTQPPFVQTTPFPQPPPQNTFPTLVNFVPSTSTVLPPSVAPPWAFTTTPLTVTAGLTQKPLGPSTIIDSSNSGVTRKKPILPPPNGFSPATGEELIELESIDRRAIHVDSRAAVEKIGERAKDATGFDKIETDISKTIVVGANTFPPPIQTNFSVQELEEKHERTESPVRTTVPDKGGWSFRIMPSKQTKPEFRPDVDSSMTFTNLNTQEKTSAWIANQTQSSTVGGPSQGNGIISGDKLNTVIDSIFSQKQTIDTITGLIGKRPPRPKSRQSVSSMTAPPPIASNLEVTTLSTFTNHSIETMTGVTGLSNQKCGVAPDFIPCLDLNRANLRLLACCRAKLLPDGCLSLCRYDTTQADVKRAFDAHKCGILNVAPFLECASGGQDNRQCCQHRNLNSKSGPQCEVFCHPRDGLGSLGLQHLTCSNVISDLLRCHHSGLKP